MYFVVAAYAALTAIGTQSQWFRLFQPVEFISIITEVGVTTNGTIAEFVCPSTALYFVHYRLRAYANGPECSMHLLSSGSSFFGIPVSFVKSYIVYEPPGFAQLVLVGFLILCSHVRL